MAKYFLAKSIFHKYAKIDRVEEAKASSISAL
jgi:hypothetical protein